MHEVVHKRSKKKRRPVGYPMCVMRDGRIMNDDGPVRTHHGIWHFKCWEEWDDKHRVAASTRNPQTRTHAYRWIRWAKLRMEGRNLNDD